MIQLIAFYIFLARLGPVWRINARHISSPGLYSPKRYYLQNLSNQLYWSEPKISFTTKNGKYDMPIKSIIGRFLFYITFYRFRITFYVYEFWFLRDQKALFHLTVKWKSINLTMSIFRPRLSGSWPAEVPRAAAVPGVVAGVGEGGKSDLINIEGRDFKVLEIIIIPICIM